MSFPGAKQATGVLALCLLIASVYWKLVFSAQYTILEAPDFANQVMPWLDLQARALRSGELPFWDPYLLGGQPLAAQMQPGVTNPLTYLLLAAPLRNGHLNPVAVHLWLVFLHMLAGVFLYALARDRGLPRAAAIAGGLIFATGGYPGHTHWPQHLSGILWMPLAALFLLRGAGAAAGLFLGLSWLSGHPQVPLLATLAAGVVLAARREWRALARMAVVTALVSAAVWLPAVEYARHAVRWVDLPQPFAGTARIPYQVHERNALPAASLPHFLIPGEPQSLANPFLGGVAVSLALLGLAARWRQARWWGLAALASLVFALARGGNPFHGILYELVPMLDKARTPAAALAITQLALAMLAAYGLAAALALEPVRSRWAPRLALALLLGAAGAFVLVLFEPVAIMRIPEGAERLAFAAFLWLLAGAAYWIWSRGDCSAAAFSTALALLIVFELSASVGFDYRRFDDHSKLAVWPRLDTETSTIATYLKKNAGDRRVELRYEDLLFNFGDWHGIETLAGYLPGVLTNTHTLGWWESRVLSLYGVGYSIARQPMHPGQREVVSAPMGGLKLYELAGALPRAWSVHQIKPLPTAAAAAHVLITGGFDLRQTAVMHGSDAPPALVPCTAARSADAAADEVRVTGRTLNSVRVEARLACRGLVIVSDNDYPGWTATIDGRATPVLTANVALRAVLVEAGTHDIAFRFRPASLYWGAVLSLFGLLLGVAAATRRSAALPESTP